MNSKNVGTPPIQIYHYNNMNFLESKCEYKCGALSLEKIEAMSCIVRAQRRVCKRRVTLGHGLEWAHKIQTETQIDLIETRIRNGLVRRGRSLPSIFAAWLRPTCHLGDFRTFMYKMMHPPPSETTRCRATWVFVRVGPWISVLVCFGKC